MSNIDGRYRKMKKKSVGERIGDAKKNWVTFFNHKLFLSNTAAKVKGIGRRMRRKER